VLGIWRSNDPLYSPAYVIKRQILNTKIWIDSICYEFITNKSVLS